MIFSLRIKSCVFSSFIGELSQKQKGHTCVSCGTVCSHGRNEIMACLCWKAFKGIPKQ